MYLYVYIDIPIYLYTYIDIPIYLYTYIVCQLNCDVLGFHRSQKGAAACAKRLDPPHPLRMPGVWELGSDFKSASLPFPSHRLRACRQPSTNGTQWHLFFRLNFCMRFRLAFGALLELILDPFSRFLGSKINFFRI